MKNMALLWDQVVFLEPQVFRIVVCVCVCVLGNVNDSYCEYARAILYNTAALDSANHHKVVRAYILLCSLARSEIIPLKLL